jgi:hypothetical protein
MKVGVIIPDRGDRPKFLDNCLRMMEVQTLQPEIIKLINFPAYSPECDITPRYKLGYERMRRKGIDVIAFIENDDWYSPDYLETMCNAWNDQGRPDIFGTTYTIYYHIRQRAHFTMHHVTRSSAMSTLIVPDMNFKWCADNDPYTDIHLWQHCGLNRLVWKPEKHICMGIKHGVGLCGGSTHTDRQDFFINKDHDKSFLKKTMDPDSFKFYSQYFNPGKNF